MSTGIKRTILGLAAVASIATAPLAMAQQAPEVPVMVGDSADFDACGSTGAVTGLDPAGDNFLAVRSGPGSDYAQIDSLNQGDLIQLCETNGRWQGIVYEPGDTMDSGPTDCGVGTPIDPPEAYSGSCRSGWIYDEYIMPVAG